MAYGQNQDFIADPQPGTSNQPYPVGNLPPFVPVTVTVVDQYAEAVYAQQEALLVMIKQLIVSLNQINNSLAKLVEINSNLSKKISDLMPALLALSTATTQAVTIKAAMISNQIQTNNFYDAATKETPKIPTIEEQLKQSITEASLMSSISSSMTAVKSQIFMMVSKVQSWIKSTAVYQEVSKWISSAKDFIFAELMPPSPKAVKSNVKSTSGDGTVG